MTERSRFRLGKQFLAYKKDLLPTCLGQLWYTIGVVIPIPATEGGVVNAGKLDFANLYCHGKCS